ncbi:MAG TPA: chemotaxis protein chel [Parvularcula sp.]|nr:chemotaxis protein chel [Parvularcula sp.]
MNVVNFESGNGSRAATSVVAPQSRFSGIDSGLSARRLDAAAKDFEAVFIAQMLGPLFASVETPAIAGGGESEGFFKSLLQESYAKAFAERGGFGLAAHVKGALLDIQARAAAAPPAENRP